MEEIIGLLIIIAVSIFKAVSNKLEKSGKPSAPAASAPEQEVQENPFDFKRWIEDVMQEAQNASKETSLEVPLEPVVKPEPVKVFEEAPKAVAPVKPAPAPVKEVAEEKPEKEKIDPKKLIIYSEIMTPKCMNNN